MEADIIRSGANEVTGSPASDWLRDISDCQWLIWKVTRIGPLSAAHLLSYYSLSSIRKIQRKLEEIGFFQNIGRNIFLPGRKKPDFSMEETAPRKKLPTLSVNDEK